jgi:metal-responsive CopG/Arc/MetJ family transcriptional regulator
VDKRPGKIRAVRFPEGLDQMIEYTRRNLGISRSRLIQTAVLNYLEKLSVLSTFAKKNTNPSASK